jgi:predicted small lipoprotein YifL
MKNAYRGLLLIATLSSGCGQKAPQSLLELPSSRRIATVYAINTPAGEISCYRAPAQDAPVVTQLRDQQLVDLVSMQNGMVQHNGDYWLHVYPRSGHRPACYLNIQHLMPVS